MDFLKELFNSGALTWEQFVQAVTDKGYKLADLSTGNYVSKRKHDDEIKTKDQTITDLNGQISKRDADIANLQTQLSDGTKSSEAKVTDLTNQLTKLQGDYSTAKTDYENRLRKQSYEFAVREFANGKKFTSNAAKRDFTEQMIQKNLQMEGQKIIGADDFVSVYTEANPDAFVVEKKDPEPQPQPQNNPLPTFVQPTPPQADPNANPFLNAFHFSGVRPQNNNNK